MIDTTLATGTSTARNPELTGRAGLAATDFQTFLKMLTTQMQNQDPLNPMNPTDFALQLATFSGVEQQVRGNALLETLVAQIGIGEFAGWVGMEARAPGPAAYRGAPLDLALAPTDGADRVFLVVRNAFGSEVDNQPVAPGTASFRWLGLGPDGAPLPDGTYSFELVSLEGGIPMQTTMPEIYARVIEARREATGPVIVLAGGITVEPEKVSALRSGS